jgi:hypothetical protein
MSNFLILLLLNAIAVGFFDNMRKLIPAVRAASVTRFAVRILGTAFVITAPPYE